MKIVFERAIVRNMKTCDEDKEVLFQQMVMVVLDGIDHKWIMMLLSDITFELFINNYQESKIKH